MTIHWPTTPNVGDTVDGPRGEVWVWDGHKWTAAAGDAGGAGLDEAPSDGKLYARSNEGWVDIRAGVEDDSFAAPGEVGEIDELSGTISISHSAATGTDLQEVAILDAGDWDISAVLVITLPQLIAAAGIRMSFQMTAGRTPARYQFRSITGNQGFLPEIQPICICGRVALRNPAPVLSVSFALTGGAGVVGYSTNIDWFVTARRMR